MRIQDIARVLLAWSAAAGLAVVTVFMFALATCHDGGGLCEGPKNDPWEAGLSTGVPAALAVVTVGLGWPTTRWRQAARRAVPVAAVMGVLGTAAGYYA